MKREFTTREKVLLVVLAVLTIAVGYYKLILEPINDSVASYVERTSQEQEEIADKLNISADMTEMQNKVDEITASQNARAIPYFDNSTDLLRELHTILCNTDDYSLQFGTMTADDYIMQRPVEMTFKTGSYADARKIIDALYASENIMKISDVNISMDKTLSLGNPTNGSDSVQVSMNLTYYELIVDLMTKK